MRRDYNTSSGRHFHTRTPRTAAFPGARVAGIKMPPFLMDPGCAPEPER